MSVLCYSLAKTLEQIEKPVRGCSQDGVLVTSPASMTRAPPHRFTDRRITMRITYFEGATGEEKAFLLRAERGLRDSRVPRLQKVRIRRHLKNPEFVRQTMQKVAEQEYWNGEETEEERLRAIDWDSIDWEAILNIVLMIMKMFL